MPMQAADTILGTQRGTAAEAVAFARAVGSKRLDQVQSFIGEAYELASRVGIDPAIVVAQSALETNNWRDDPWSLRLNPAGMGVTPNHDFGHSWASGADAARGQIVHLWLYARGTPLPPDLAPHLHLDPRADKIPQANLGNARTLTSLGEKWAGVRDYGQRIANRSRDIFPNLPNQAQEQEHQMGMTAHRFVGLDRDVFLPDDITVEIDIVPDDKIGWVRSGVRETGQTYTTFHDTGTPGSTARKQRNYLHNGPMKWVTNEQGDRVLVRDLKGFNFAVDDTRVIQLTPLNEVTWAAGVPQGNRVGWHTELCYGGDINWEKSLRNAIALHAGLIVAKGWRTDTALVTHKHWSGKWCPAQVLNNWDSIQRRVDEATRGVIDPNNITPTFAEPEPIPELAPFQGGDPDTAPALVRAADGTPFFYVADRVKATRPTPRLQRGNMNARRVGPDLKTGEEFDVTWIFASSADNELYYVTPFHTRIRVADTARVGDRTGPRPAPMEAPPTREELEGLQPDDLGGLENLMPVPASPAPEADDAGERVMPPEDDVPVEAPGH